MTEHRSPRRRRAARDALVAAGCIRVLARLYAARGIDSAAELDHALARAAAARRCCKASTTPRRVLADAIAAARAHRHRRRLRRRRRHRLRRRRARPARARRGRRLPRAQPLRVRLRPHAGDRRARRAHDAPRLIVTVDNGIASVDGVAAAAALGIDVLVTDHHLPGAALPAPAIIVNPNQPGCGFPSKHLAGVGVMFYVLLATARAAARARRVRRAAEPESRRPARPRRARHRRRRRAARPRTTASWSRRASRASAPAARSRASPRCSRVAGRDARARDRVRPGLRRRPAPQRRRAASPTCRSASAACSPTTDGEALHARAPSSTASTASGARSRRRCRTRRSPSSTAVDAAAGDAATRCACSTPNGTRAWSASSPRASRTASTARRSSSRARGGGELKGSGRSIAGFHLRDALDVVAKREPGHRSRASAATPSPPGLSLARSGAAAVRARPSRPSRASCSTPAQLARTLDSDGALAPRRARRSTLAARLRERRLGPGVPGAGVRRHFRRRRAQRIVGGKPPARSRSARRRALRGDRCSGTPTRCRRASARLYRPEVNEWHGHRRLELVDRALAAWPDAP